ncbi:MAG: hypothetical protein M1819_004302 [Sarea resinae]|nr:MAG: hypothetical protein M1819_004302 [Sarea resinae]
MDISWLLGRARTSFHHATNSVSLPLLPSSQASTSQTLSELCESITPPCNLNPLLFNGHLQTAWTALRTGDDIPIHYKRKLFTAEDSTYAGTFAVDFVVPAPSSSSSSKSTPDPTLPPRTSYFTPLELSSLSSDDTRPMLVSLHGLSGGSHEIYLRHVLAPLVTEEGGWEACVVNSRGCAMSKITTPVLYNARATWDMRQTVRWLREAYPNRPLFAIGYSLGANILVNYLGEEGPQCVLKAAVVCSNPWNLEVSSLALQRTWLGLEVYSKTMGTSMKRLFENHIEAVSKNPRVDIAKVMGIKYLHEFDRALQGPTWGYPTEGAYYRDASSSDSVLNVRIPLFAIHAIDDPIAVDEGVPYEEIKQNPYTVLCATSTGGHLSWFEPGGGRWFARPAVNFLNTLAKTVDWEAMSRAEIVEPEWAVRYDMNTDIEINSETGVDNADNDGVAMKKGLARRRFSPMRRKLHDADE